MARLVDALREKIQVNMRGGAPAGGRSQSIAFEISFEWNDPELVAPVTNALASRFIEENLNAREEMAISTTDFLEKETSTIRVELEAREKELETFKRANMGMLPDELQSNISILNQLGEELLNLERRLESEKQQALLLTSQNQLARAERSTQTSTNRAAREQASPPAGTRTGTAMTTDELTSGSLEDLEVELQRMSSLYTEKHPDILALKRRIEALRKEGPRTSPISSNAQTQESTQHSRLLNAQLAPINANIEAYKRQIQEVEKQIQIYKQHVERTPQVEMELNKITRDYQTVRQRYDDLLSKKLDAKLAEQMEKRKKGEQFRVLDPAVKPPKPFKPNVRKVLAMALMAGLALGCGLAYLREMLDPRFFSPEDVESFLGVPVMVSLPLADHPDKA